MGGGDLGDLGGFGEIWGELGRGKERAHPWHACDAGHQKF